MIRDIENARIELGSDSPTRTLSSDASVTIRDDLLTFTIKKWLGPDFLLDWNGIVGETTLMIYVNDTIEMIVEGEFTGPLLKSGRHGTLVFGSFSIEHIDDDPLRFTGKPTYHDVTVYAGDSEFARGASGWVDGEIVRIVGRPSGPSSLVTQKRLTLKRGDETRAWFDGEFENSRQMPGGGVEATFRFHDARYGPKPARSGPARRESKKSKKTGESIMYRIAAALIHCYAAIGITIAAVCVYQGRVDCDTVEIEHWRPAYVAAIVIRWPSLVDWDEAEPLCEKSESDVKVVNR